MLKQNDNFFMKVDYKPKPKLSVGEMINILETGIFKVVAIHNRKYHFTMLAWTSMAGRKVYTKQIGSKSTIVVDVSAMDNGIERIRFNDLHTLKTLKSLNQKELDNEQ